MCRVNHLSLKLEEVNGSFVVKFKVAPFLLLLTTINWILHKVNLIWKAFQVPSFSPPTYNIQQRPTNRPPAASQRPVRAGRTRFRRRTRHCPPSHSHPVCLGSQSQIRPQPGTPPPPPYSDGMRQGWQRNHGQSGTVTPEQQPLTTRSQSPGPATRQILLPPDFWARLRRPPPTERELD